MAHFWMKAHVPFVLTRRERVKIILEYGLIQLRVGLCACVCGGFWGFFFFFSGASFSSAFQFFLGEG